VKARHHHPQTHRRRIHEHQPAEVTALDVRQIAPRRRHTLIFGTFDRLNTGQALLW
jgi:uncharacterized protein (DUF2249 family)